MHRNQVQSTIQEVVRVLLDTTVAVVILLGNSSLECNEVFRVRVGIVKDDKYAWFCHVVYDTVQPCK